MAAESPHDQLQDQCIQCRPSSDPRHEIQGNLTGRQTYKNDEVASCKGILPKTQQASINNAKLSFGKASKKQRTTRTHKVQSSIEATPHRIHLIAHNAKRVTIKFLKRLPSPLPNAKCRRIIVQHLLKLTDHTSSDFVRKFVGFRTLLQHF